MIPLLLLLALAEGPARPNVVIVMTDDQGLGDFSFTGNPVLKTPHFDAFARESVRLTDFHVCPMCSPTRGQLLTGLAALRNGATSVTAGRTFLRPGLPTLADVFAKAGYKTGLFGKWHLGDSYPHRPTDKGFHEAVYHLGWGLLHSTPEFDRPLIDGRYFHNGVEKKFKGHCTDLWFDAATAWMKERKGKGEPFVCYLPTNAPHAPHVELAEYVKPYEGKGPAGFFGMIAHLDRRFGDLTRFLADQKLDRDTIVVFMTDNGGTAGVKVFNAGLRAGKTTYYEGGHRVPCWVRWPGGKLGDPRDVGVPTQNTDLLPTLCDLCGVAPPKAAAADAAYRGTSLAGLLRGEAKGVAERKFVVQYGQTPKKFDSCVVWGKWRLVGGAELYDVEADRAQKSDLAAKRPDVVKEMREYYEGWWKGLEPTLNDFVPIALGAGVQPVVELTSGDWEGIYADNTGYVREAVGGKTGGHWHVHVEKAGDYVFTLRRWPEQTGAALGAAYEPSAKSPANKAKIKTVAFPTIASAHIDVAGLKAKTKADPAATGATLTVKLPAGRTKLKAWFADADGNDLCGAFFVTVERKSPRKPNVLFIAVDDLNHWVGHLGRNKQAKTPNIDRLAKMGVTFTRAYCAAPVCNPSRAALMSGMRPGTSGIYDNGQNWKPVVPKERTLTTRFLDAGYNVYGSGKIYHSSAHRPGEWTDYLVGGKGKVAAHPSAKDDGVGGIKFQPLTDDSKLPDEAIVDYGIKQLMAKHDKPFFVAVGLHKPHMPWNVPKKYYDLFPLEKIELPPTRKGDLDDVPPGGLKMAKADGDHATMLKSGRWKEAVQAYLATIAYCDAQVGRLLDAYEKSPDRENTVVVFWGDHGWHLGEKEHWRKFALWEESTRMPFVWVAPGVTKPGGVCDRTVDLMSVYPTLCTLCGLDRPKHVEGEDIRPLLADPKAKWERPGITTFHRNNHAVRTERWRYIRYADGGEELYDHDADEYEWKNLAGEAKWADVKAGLKKLLPAVNEPERPRGKE